MKHKKNDDINLPKKDEITLKILIKNESFKLIKICVVIQSVTLNKLKKS